MSNAPVARRSVYQTGRRLGVVDLIDNISSNLIIIIIIIIISTNNITLYNNRLLLSILSMIL